MRRPRRHAVILATGPVTQYGDMIGRRRETPPEQANAAGGINGKKIESSP